MSTRPSTEPRPDSDNHREPSTTSSADVVGALGGSGGAMGASPVLDANALAGVRFLRSFRGPTADEAVLAAIRRGHASGVTLFRAKNVETPEQVRALCAALQAARPAGDPPLLIGFDQEGGQLQVVGDGATAWPGNLALGAAGSEELARRCGRAIGTEVAAMGGTLVYAPVCDVLHRISATPLGTRPFGDDPSLVAGLAAAMVEGLQQAGVAATLKHFPGHGAAAADSHVAMPVVGHDLAELRRAELPPFRAGIAAGAAAVLPGHLAVPALTGGELRPATVSPEILRTLLRGELNFGGVTVSDALDMAGATYADGLGGTVGAAAEAGMDLLLMNHAPEIEESVFEALRGAIASGKLDADGLIAARDRIVRLREHLGTMVQPPLEAVGSAEHRKLAREIAEASVTLVRDPQASLPLRPGEGSRIAVVAPAPVDLTPAETSSYLQIELVDFLRKRGFAADEFQMPLDPSEADIDALISATAGYETAIVCTFDAVSFAGQRSLIDRAAAARAGNGGWLVAVATRSPYDVATYPATVTSVCTYGVQPTQIEALADALAGLIPFAGRLPVRLEADR